jgi:hypothetical protein
VSTQLQLNIYIISQSNASVAPYVSYNGIPDGKKIKMHRGDLASTVDTKFCKNRPKQKQSMVI